MLFCSIDSKAAGWKHGALRQAKKLSGLPSVAFLDRDGRVLVTVPPDDRDVDGFRRFGRRAEEFVRLRAAAAAGGDAASASRFLLMQLEERQLELAEARERRSGLWPLAADEPGGERELRAAIDRRIVDLEVGAALRSVPNERRHTLGARFLKILREGPEPSVHVSRGLYFAVLEWAEREGDAAAFAEALDAMRDALAVTDPGESWVEPLLARYRGTLERLKMKRGG